jgi:hypothetical protein
MAIDHPWLGPTRPLLESPRTAYQQPCPSSPLPRMHARLPAATVFTLRIGTRWVGIQRHAVCN